MHQGHAPSVAGRVARWAVAHGSHAFFASVCLFFFLLPLHADASATIAVMTLLAVWACWRGDGLRPLVAGSARLSLGAFVVFLCVAVLASALNPETFGRLPRALLWGCCIFSGVMLRRDMPGHGSAFLWALCAAIGFSFAAALLFGGYAQPGIWHDGRLKLFAIHPSRLALYCAICFLFLLHRAAVDTGVARLAASLAAVGIFFILYKTNTRGNLLMIPLGLACLVATHSRAQWKYFGAVAGICVLLGGAFLWSGAHTGTGARLISAATDVTNDPNFKSRLPIWEAGWEGFKASPFVGHGMHSYRGVHAAYTATHGDALTARYGGYEPSVKQAHNLVLGRLVEVGLVGTVAFFIFYGGAILAAWRGLAEYRWLVAPLAFYCAMSLLDDGLFRVNDAFILFLAGTALGAPAARRTEGDVSPPR